MKHLFALLLLWQLAQPIYSQAIPKIMPPVSLERILVGIQPGFSLEAVGEIFAEAQCFLPTDERMLLSRGGQVLAWLDPNASQRPTNEVDLYSLLEQLEQNPAIRFAHPFVKSPNGALFGITETVLIKLKNGKQLEGLKAIAQYLGAVSLRENKFISELYHLELDKYSLADPMSIAVYLQGKGFEYVDLDYLINPIVATNDVFFNRQWSIKNTGSFAQGSGTPGADMAVEDAWNITTGDPNVRIAIIDSGTDTTHPDLMPNLLSGYDATGGGSEGYPNTTFPNDAHGTNCAGIVGAKGENTIGIAGVCYDCSIFPVKVFYYVFNPFGNPLPFSRGSDMADAISWAWQVGGADVLSSSWGILDNLIPVLPDGTAPAENAIQLALDSARGGKGIAMFFSSGNDGGKPIWPGRLYGCISVNATSMCDQAKTPTSCDGQNWAGNWGDSLDVSAPGVRVAATDLRGNNGYAPGDYYLTFGGTSAACPNAAGVMGLILSVNPNLSFKDARFILESTCDKVGGYSYTGTLPNGSWAPELGHGRLNAYNAVQAAQISLASNLPEKQDFDLEIIPNPATNFINIAYHLSEISPVSIEIRDVAGRSLFHKDWEQQAPGPYKLKLTQSDIFLQPGLVFLTLNVSGFNFTRKILIIR
ncbi:MAG TPA: hypothetical protein ENJ82_15065 [Bacteroidetes bacterium]|nr:hypothetical protein [Bacteroidota bacterium]